MNNKLGNNAQTLKPTDHCKLMGAVIKQAERTHLLELAPHNTPGQHWGTLNMMRSKYKPTPHLIRNADLADYLDS